MTTRRYHLKDWESFYDSLERHGIIPLHQLRSYSGRDWLDPLTFHRILGPHVVDVKFWSWRSQCPLVGTLPPSLHALRFYDIDQIDLSIFYPSLLEALPHLEILYAPTSLPIPDDVLRHVLSSGVLQELELGNFPVDFRRCMPSGTPLRLRHFGLRTEKLEECDAVLASLNLSRLQSIKVHYPDDEVEVPLASQVQSWFEMVATYCPTLLLTKIEFDCTWDYLADDPREESRITMQTMEPLLQFRNLEELVVASPTRFHLDNESLRVFSRSWPRMRRLDLNSRFSGWGDVDDYDISLDGLAFLAQSWPDLEYLNLCLTASADSFYDSIEDVDVELENLHSKGANGCWQLRSLGVGWDSPMVYRPLVVAAFLHGIFPNLSSILDLDSSEPLSREWKEVEDVLKYSIGLRERTLQARRLG